jgi:hypothetical protein
VKARVQSHLDDCKRRIDERLEPNRVWTHQHQPMFKVDNIHYDLPEPSRVRAVSCAGLGAIHLMVGKLGLAAVIDERLHLLKRHLPYFESDHVLNLAYNLLAGGTALHDLQLLRNQAAYLDSLKAQRIPAPSTAGDFLRRFDEPEIQGLMDGFNDVRLRVWQQQPAEFFEHGILDADGSLTETLGECKEGMDYSYQGSWGYHPLVISLANTQEPLFLCNRSGNRPSHEHAAEYLDRGVALLRRAGFVKISLRGDTDFSQTKHLDGWHRQDLRLVFGIDAHQTLVARAESLAEESWQVLPRRAKYEVKTKPRDRPVNVKEQKVIARGYKQLKTIGQWLSSFSYQPQACQEIYRIVVLKKHLEVRQRGQRVREEIRYFFWITNEWEWSAEEVLDFAHQRCNQENLIQQLKNGVRALHAPVNTLKANWAYQVIASLAWSLKAWLALLQEKAEDKKTLLSIEFKKFINELMRIPAEVIRGGRRLTYRLLAWRPWAAWLFRSVEVLRRLKWR